MTPWNALTRRAVAVLHTVADGGSLTLDGGGSADTRGAITSYAWDLDRDGAFDDATGAGPTAAFPEAFEGLIALRVTADGRERTPAFVQEALEAQQVRSADLRCRRVTGELPPGRSLGPIQGAIPAPQRQGDQGGRSCGSDLSGASFSAPRSWWCSRRRRPSPSPKARRGA